MWIETSTDGVDWHKVPIIDRGAFNDKGEPNAPLDVRARRMITIFQDRGFQARGPFSEGTPQAPLAL